jgi:hypothetical protein
MPVLVSSRIERSNLLWCRINWALSDNKACAFNIAYTSLEWPPVFTTLRPILILSSCSIFQVGKFQEISPYKFRMHSVSTSSYSQIQAIIVTQLSLAEGYKFLLVTVIWDIVPCSLIEVDRHSIRAGLIDWLIVWAETKVSEPRPSLAYCSSPG